MERNLLLTANSLNKSQIATILGVSMPTLRKDLRKAGFAFEKRRIIYGIDLVRIHQHFFGT
jgi:predicted XRE-type DNA-binding protein